MDNNNNNSNGIMERILKQMRLWLGAPQIAPTNEELDIFDTVWMANTPEVTHLSNEIIDDDLQEFKKGGRIKGKKNKPVKIIVHSGEVIIPNSLPKLQKEVIKIINKIKKSKNKKI